MLVSDDLTQICGHLQHIIGYIGFVCTVFTSLLRNHFILKIKSSIDFISSSSEANKQHSATNEQQCCNYCNGSLY